MEEKHPQTSRLVCIEKEEKTPSRGQIYKIYTQKSREQEENLRNKKEQEKTK